MKITVNGLEMYYEIHGSGPGQPLVLLHGAFGNAEGWGTLLPTLAKTRQIIIIEQQGHGHTADRDAPLSYAQMADDTAALLTQLNVGPVDLFGYSSGGVVAFGLAIHYPDLVRKLAVLGSHTAPIQNAFEPEKYRQFQSIPADFAPPPLKEPYDRMAPDPTRWPVLVSKLKALENDFAGYSAAEVASIAAPTLILQGDRDGVRPEHAVEIFRQISNAQLAIVPGGDHFLLWSDAEKVLSTLLPFLDAPPPQA